MLGRFFGGLGGSLDVTNFSVGCLLRAGRFWRPPSTSPPTTPMAGSFVDLVDGGMSAGQIDEEFIKFGVVVVEIFEGQFRIKVPG